MRSIISILIVLAVCTVLQARIIFVADTIGTIQEGINKAQHGDTVLVNYGIYYENIDFKGKAIVVGSRFLTEGLKGYIDVTIINGSKPKPGGPASVVSFTSGEDTNSVLTGFTITGGSGTITEFNEAAGEFKVCGGGIRLVHSGARISHNHIIGNTVMGNRAGGAGISQTPLGNEHWVIIEHNEISGNTCLGEAEATGAGIELYGNGRIQSNIIKNNSCTASLEVSGGGIYIHGGECLVLKNKLLTNTLYSKESAGGTGCFMLNADEKSMIMCNEIAHNKMETMSGRGGGIGISGSPVTVANNVIHHNFAIRGGGISICRVEPDPFPVLVNNTIADNQGALSGAGLYVEHADPLIFNTIFWNPGKRNEIDMCNAHPTVKNCTISDEKWASLNDGIFCLDPKFENSEYELSAHSGCIGTGCSEMNSGVTKICCPQCDYKGCLRPYPVDKAIDLGAVESVFSGKPYPVSTNLSKVYAKPGKNNMNIKMRLYNPSRKLVAVKAVLLSKNYKELNEINLTKQSESEDPKSSDVLYKGTFKVPPVEDYYRLSILVENKAENDGLLFLDNQYFTTVGPVGLNKIEIVNKDEKPTTGLHTVLQVRLFLQNTGKKAIAENVNFRLQFIGTENIIIKENVVSHVGDMAPGEISHGDKDFLIIVPEGMEGNDFQAHLVVESNGQVYWNEKIDVMYPESSSKTKPAQVDLLQNFPNPFNPVTAIRFQLPYPSEVHISIYNLLGQEVAVLVSEEKPAGTYSLQWGASGLPSGVYFCKMVAQGKNSQFSKTRKLTILR